MFLRETEGVYRFGQRRVHIKIERGDQLLVRVGGGFQHIDQFIQEFTNAELERINRRDVTSRFSNKTALQGIAINHAQGGRESSPIKDSQRAESPMRSSRKSSIRISNARAESPSKGTSSPRKRPSSPMKKSSKK
jgi:hypothetical protein